MSLQAWDCGISCGRNAVARFVLLAVRHRVEDAVEILQNIHRHIEDGLSPIEAALTARHEDADNHWRALSTGSNAAFHGDGL
jgi:hypothetical protein